MKSVPPRGSGWVCWHLARLDACKEASITSFAPYLLCSLTSLGSIATMMCSPGIMWNDTDTPLAYFMSFRTYGTWLHGDKRGSIDRFHNRYRSPYVPQDDKWRDYNEQRLKTKPLILKGRHRRAIHAAIRETCDIRKWSLYAINVRTNHIHRWCRPIVSLP
jgi:hypothetical protein